MNSAPLNQTLNGSCLHLKEQRARADIVLGEFPPPAPKSAGNGRPRYTRLGFSAHCSWISHPRSCPGAELSTWGDHPVWGAEGWTCKCPWWCWWSACCPCFQCTCLENKAPFGSAGKEQLKLPKWPTFPQERGRANDNSPAPKASLETLIGASWRTFPPSGTGAEHTTQPENSFDTQPPQKSNFQFKFENSNFNPTTTELGRSCKKGKGLGS